MIEVFRQGIYYHISEPDRHNQNLVECVIREVRRKWYRSMAKKRVPSQLWDYGISWVSELMPTTHLSANSLNGGIYLTNVTGNTVNISEYPDFCFYEKVLFKDNSVLSAGEIGRW